MMAAEEEEEEEWAVEFVNKVLSIESCCGAAGEEVVSLRMAAAAAAAAARFATSLLPPRTKPVCHSTPCPTRPLPSTSISNRSS